MNTIENIDEVRFPNIYILPHSIYHAPPLTIINGLSVNAVGFSMDRQTFSNIFAIHYGDIKD